MIKIKNIKIGKGFKPVIVAEMSGNHNQSLERALKIVESAAKSGAKMLKLQTYTPDTMTINSDKRDFYISDKKVCGMEKIFINFTKLLLHLGIGMPKLKKNVMN